jgi:hypothetical protein
MNKELLQEMISSLLNGGEFNYEDSNIKINMGPSGIFIQSSNKKDLRTYKDIEVGKFLDFCKDLDDDLFIAACETFDPETLATLEKELDTDNYRNTITTFTSAVKEVAKLKLESMITAADVEIREHEKNIFESQQVINQIHKDLDEVQSKYNTIC